MVILWHLSGTSRGQNADVNVEAGAGAETGPEQGHVTAERPDSLWEWRAGHCGASGSWRVCPQRPRPCPPGDGALSWPAG